MLIFPAIDIIDNKCVRLTQGDYNRKKIYSSNPIEVVKKFENDGVSFLHTIDLDGAKKGKLINFKTIKKIANSTNLSIQVGGGIRTVQDADKLFEIGIDKIILGTSAISDKTFLKKLLTKYGSEKIIVSIDAKDENILVEGWLKNSGKNLFQFINELKQIGVTTIIYTDIKQDGMMKGINLENIKQVIKSGLNIIVAGGISSIEDLYKLKEINAYGAIIGKAIYENKINLSLAIKNLQINNLAKRIIPCMDIKNCRTVKGTNFVNLKNVGDPIELAKKYSESGADELVFLDITATVEGRKTLCKLVYKISQNINIPFTVGGGIKSVSDIKNLLNNGADKVAICSAAVKNPKLITESTKTFGSQCIVISIDAKKIKNNWNIFINGGRINTRKNVIEFSKKMEKLGAGELLVNSLDQDGTKNGYDIELLKKIKQSVNIPVIASSGAGKKSDFLDAFKKSNVDAVLAASVFHYGQIKIRNLKKYLQLNQITIRP